MYIECMYISARVAGALSYANTFVCVPLLRDALLSLFLLHIHTHTHRHARAHIHTNTTALTHTNTQTHTHSHIELLSFLGQSFFWGFHCEFLC